MREHDLELLELPAVLGRLAAATDSEPGAAFAHALRPSGDEREVLLRQQRTAEAIALLDEAAEPELGDVADVRDEAALAERGGALDTRALIRVAHTISAGVAARRVVTDRSDLPGAERPHCQDRAVARLGRRRDRPGGRGGRDPICGTPPHPISVASAASSAKAGASSPSDFARSRATPHSRSTYRTTS